MTQVSAYQPAYSSYAYTPVGVQSTNNAPANGTSTNTYAEDNWQSKRAGGWQRFSHGVSNLFDSMSDWVGLGTISHYAKAQLKSFDADKSNSLNINEFSTVSQALGISFQQVDRNSNQELSLGEFKTIVSDLIKTNMAKVDTDGDGFLNYNEAMSGGYVIARGNTNSFALHDANQDQLLSRREFAGLVNDIHLIKGQH